MTIQAEPAIMKLYLYLVIILLTFLLPTKAAPPTIHGVDTPHLKADVELKTHLEAPQHKEFVKLATIAVEKPKPAPAPPKTASKPVVRGGSCADWMRQAGIPQTHATNKLILNESGCKWWAVNPYSGACGIPQAYPCSKLPCPLTEAGAVCQLQWMKNYVSERYGTWEAALSFWYAQCPTKQGCWY